MLGRYQSFKEWDTLGVLGEMDGLFDSDGNVCDGPALQRAWQRWDEAYLTGKDPATEARMLKVKGLPSYRKVNLPVWMASGRGSTPMRDPAFGEYLGREKERLSGPQPDAARSAARRGFCKRRGQAQRWWHNENVPLLDFTNEAMAQSIGMSAAELQAVEPSWEACDVVFDALSRSQSGLVDKALIDERRAAYETVDGAFDIEAFRSDLTAGRVNVATSLAIFPGLLNVVFVIAFLQADGLSYAADSWENLLTQVGKNTAIWGGLLQGQGL